MTAQRLSDLLRLARTRRATRDFEPHDVPEATLRQCLDAARWAPSGYNLQPTHFIVVRDAAQRKRLRWACFDQRQLEEAPAVVVFAGHKHAASEHFETVLSMDREAGATNDHYEQLLQKYVPLAFNTGPLGFGWAWKALAPLGRYLGAAVPSIPAVHRRYWLAKQTALAAMNFMLAAHAAGLASCPMEGFDERRVRQVLNMPRPAVPIVVVPVGYPAKRPRVKTRLPADHLVHWERW